MTTPDDARSALNLRLALAGFGLVLCLGLGVLALQAGYPLGGAALLLLAAVAAVDLVVVQRRRLARDRAHRGAGHRHDSLFE